MKYEKFMLKVIQVIVLRLKWWQQYGWKTIWHSYKAFKYKVTCQEYRHSFDITGIDTNEEPSKNKHDMINKRKKEAEKMALNGIISIEVTRTLVQQWV